MTAREKIQRYLNERGMSQTEFADLCEIHQSRLNDYMRGAGQLTLRVAKPVARRMGTTIDWLIDDRGDWPPPGREAAAPPALGERDQAILHLAHALGGAGRDWFEMAKARLLGLPLPLQGEPAARVEGEAAGDATRRQEGRGNGPRAKGSPPAG